MDPSHKEASRCEGRCCHPFSYHNKMVPRIPDIVTSLSTGMSQEAWARTCLVSVASQSQTSFLFSHICWQRASIFLSICSPLTRLLPSVIRTLSETSLLPLQISVTSNSGWRDSTLVLFLPPYPWPPFANLIVLCPENFYILTKVLCLVKL